MVSTTTGFIVALGVAVLLVRAAHSRQPGLLDPRGAGPQKFHGRDAPRVGGLAVALGLVTALTVLAFRSGYEESARWGFLLALAGAPVFATGLAEDLTKKVRPRWRLLAAFVSAFLAVGVAGVVMVAPDLWGVAWLLSFPVVAVLLTAGVVASLSHAVNLIDGFNGLASMCVVLMLAALAVVAYDIGDVVVGQLALVTIGAVLGFFILNYPAGLIFLGDGGAYFLGFWYAELSLLLLARNPGELSPLFPVLVCVYPAFETIFSVYRRRIRGHAASQADGVHLHSLIYRRFLRWAVGDADARALTRSNSMTAPYLWLLSMSAVVPAVLFYEHTWVMLLFIALFIVSYLVLYWRIVHFRTPGWIRHTTAVLAGRLEAARAEEGSGK
jgi:UDP-N-acetylmuramyl pentapeptide phosphotransferase/UDP-N-acetylglucosamine-1-phosphate transferase